VEERKGPTTASSISNSMIFLPLSQSFLLSVVGATAVSQLLEPHQIGGPSRISITQHYFDEPVRQAYNTNGEGYRADRSGLSVWPCALPLLRHCRDTMLPALESQLGQKPRILELGAGCGLLGLGLAAAGASVVLTDPGVETTFHKVAEPIGSTLSWLENNIEHNVKEHGITDVAVGKLLWGDSEDIENIKRLHGPFDLVVGSDLLYDHKHHKTLLRTIQAFDAAALLAFPLRTDREEVFLSEAQRDFSVFTAPLEGDSIEPEVMPAMWALLEPR